MSFEFKTPILRKTTEALSAVLDSISDGSVDRDAAKLVIGVSNAASKSVKSEIDARLAAQKIAALEAKMINQVKHEAIAA